jgi:ribosomal protein L37AE/L43A
MAGAERVARMERSSGGTTCPECKSSAIRPSRTVYPLDKEKNPGGRLGFWRCSHCGARFPGPAVSEGKRHRREHVHDPLAHSLGVARMTKRWVFPVVVILITAVAVAFILHWRNRL